MSGDVCLACTCGAELLIVAEVQAAATLTALWNEVHSGEGHESTWPLGVTQATCDLRSNARIEYDL